MRISDWSSDVCSSDLAGDRAGFICQAQSLNVFVPADVHKRDLHQIHFQAWKKGVKSLYYCRSKSIQPAESALPMTTTATVPQLGTIASTDITGGVTGGDQQAVLEGQGGSVRIALWVRWRQEKKKI